MGLQCLREGIPASVISDMDAPMISLGGRTVPDGAVGIKLYYNKSLDIKWIMVWNPNFEMVFNYGQVHANIGDQKYLET